MKKIFASILLILACICSVTAFACKQDAEKFNVTFDANGGLINGQATVSVEVISGETVTSVGTPEKDGETFIYWTLDGAEYDFTTPVTSNLTLKAEYGSAQTLTFTQGEGYKYVFENEVGTSVAYGATVEFAVELGAYKDGPITVKANDQELAVNQTSGKYSVTVTEATTVTVSGVRDAVSSMTGSGTQDDPYVVAKPIDLKFIADKVNAGSASYVTAHYIMYNDIDFKGEEMEIIGDLRSDYAYFNGYFNGNSYALKNFVINAENKSYVGVFGCVMANPYDASLGTLYALRLTDYEINASVTQDINIFCGSYIGYAQGANVHLCIAEGGEINVDADDSYYAFVGGAIGVQESMYLEDYDANFISSVAYANIDVQVNANSGSIYAAGGISGAVYAADANASTYITCSFSSGSVIGAMRSGGIVGLLGRWCSVSNSYSKSEISAQSSWTDKTLGEENCYAYGGGLVGYAENDTSVADCFAVGSVSAYGQAGDKYAVYGGIIGGKDAAYTATVSSEQAVENNCYYAEGGVDQDNGINLKDGNFIVNNLKWGDHDWIIGSYLDENGETVILEYPTINYGESDVNLILTVNYNGQTVGGQSSKTLLVGGVHVTLASWMENGDLEEFVVADSGLCSYGYFFDKECTRKVPAGFITTRNITVYVGFIDYSAVEGTYYIQNDSTTETLSVTLYDDGTFDYSDGSAITSSTYIYNGEFIVLKDCRFARYSNLTLTDATTGDALSEVLKHELYDFRADVTESGIIIYDGEDGDTNAYILKSQPLVASKTQNVPYGEYYVKGATSTEYYTFNSNTVGYCNGVRFTYELVGTSIVINDGEKYGENSNGKITIGGVELKAYDEFQGTWEFSATVNKTFTFDGIDAWTMYDATGKTAVEDAGKYTIDNQGALNFTLTNGTKCVATVTDGYMQIKMGEVAQTYYAENSFKGEWSNAENKISLKLNGISANGVGTGVIDYLDVTDYEITYMVIGYNTIAAYSDGEIMGFFTFNGYGNRLVGEVYLASTAAITANVIFLSHDDYQGEWISEVDLFELISFNGFGSYTQTQNGVKGLVTVGEDQVEYTLVNSTLNGSFTYEGVTYNIRYDEVNGTITLSYGENTVTLQRKDAMANTVLVAADGTTFSFDGYGELANGGKMVETSASGTVNTYTYKLSGSGENLVITYGDNKTITVSGNKYVTSNNDQLLVKTLFSGQWAISNTYNTLSVAHMTIDGKMDGTYLGDEIELTYINAEKLSFEYDNQTYYVFWLEEDNAAISTDERLKANNYTALSPIDEVYGKVFKNALGAKLQFDGMAKSTYTYGRATTTAPDGKVTEYYYDYDKKGGLMMWGVNTVGGRTLNFKLQPCDQYVSGAYNYNGQAYKLVEIDSFYLITATDESTGKTYEFDGMSISNKNGRGTVVCSDGTQYTYQIHAYNDDYTARVSFFTADGEQLIVTVNYEDGQNIKIIFTATEE
ncbi:MAG: InlB B-repeat-containing protein [Clostridia bacterium]|nr:InlB B-repeat-containing protein [Clostridia bacterium]